MNSQALQPQNTSANPNAHWRGYHANIPTRTHYQHTRRVEILANNELPTSQLFLVCNDIIKNLN